MEENLKVADSQNVEHGGEGPPPLELMNLHQVLSDARFRAENKEDAMEPISIRVETHLKKRAQEICRGNGTTLVAFLREVVIRLNAEY